MTTIRSFTNQAEAALCASFLQANGFDAVLLDEGAFHSTYGGGTAIPIRLQLPDEEAVDALNLLKSLRDDEEQQQSED
jgi:hypothetical protein